MVERCLWGEFDELGREYHDKEWGVPIHDDRILFEFLILEGAQAGLSWSTILKRRENYREAFDNFDYEKIADYDEKKVERLLRSKGIIRNRLKIRSVITNAKAFLEVRKEFGSFDRYVWGFVNYQPIQNKWKTLKELPAKTELSDKISKDLKKRGFKFAGSKIIYAFMQAIGMINDHTINCFRYREVKELSNSKRIKF